jgi:hypothetical protein
MFSSREVTQPTAMSTYWLGQQSGTFLRTKDEDAQLNRENFWKYAFIFSQERNNTKLDKFS